MQHRTDDKLRAQAGAQVKVDARRRAACAAAFSGSVAGCIAGLAAALPTARPAQARMVDNGALRFALIGDIPYNNAEESRLAAILEAIATEGMQFAVHIGDIKSGWETCSDELYARRVRLLDASPVPLVLLPGDNEWADCGRVATGRFDPFERLERLRAFIAPGPESLGQRRIALERQSTVMPRHAFPENVRWVVGRTVFVGINVPGPNNGFAMGNDAHAETRDRANLAWIDASLDLAIEQRAAVFAIAMQANPKFDEAKMPLTRLAGQVDGYRRLRTAMIRALDRFAGHVLLLHGDTHSFRADFPLANLGLDPQYRFQRVESFGSPFASSWAVITIDHSVNPPALISARHLSGAPRSTMVGP